MGIGGLPDHADIVREALGLREYAASITPSSYGKKVEAEMPAAFAALDALVAEHVAALQQLRRDGHGTPSFHVEDCPGCALLGEVPRGIRPGEPGPNECWRNAEPGC